MQENVNKEFVKRGVQFWEAVLDLSPEPAALYGFGLLALAKSVDPDTWERLMVSTCEAAAGLVEDPTWVIERASSGGKPTESGVQIIKLILRANKHLLNDLAVSDTLNKMQKNGVSIDI